MPSAFGRYASMRRPRRRRSSRCDRRGTIHRRRSCAGCVSARRVARRPCARDEREQRVREHATHLARHAGSIATQRPRSSSSQMPGAEPWLFFSLRAPSGSIACCLFAAGIGRWNSRVKRSSIQARCSSSSTISRPNSAAIDGLVRSSLVGPRPPVVMTAPVRSSASRTAVAISRRCRRPSYGARSRRPRRRARARGAPRWCRSCRTGWRIAGRSCCGTRGDWSRWRSQLE